MFLSVIVPSLNEARAIVDTLQVLQPGRQQGVEVILADAGSSDQTVQLAAPLVDRHMVAPRGRALQMNAGAAHARGDWLLFLHADTQLPRDYLQQIRNADSSGCGWGFFPVYLTGRQPLLRLVEFGMNWRSRLSRVATGDQAIFARRSLWTSLQGFADLPLMEDVEFSKRARRQGRPFLAASRLRTSSRRWQQRGIVRTILLMWWLRLQYWLGVDPKKLARRYH